MSDNNSESQGAKTPTPPAFSFTTLVNFLDGFKDGSVPSHIDKSVYPSTMSFSNKAVMPGALKFLGLISESNVPEPIFHELVKADEAGKVELWRQIISDKYQFLFEGLDIKKTTTAVVMDRFKAQNISGDTVRKAITFFLHAAKVAKMEVSQHVKAPKPAFRKTKKEKSDSVDSQKEINQDAGTGKGVEKKIYRKPYDVLIDIMDKKMTDEEQQAVWTLIRYLKNSEPDDE